MSSREFLLGVLVFYRLIIVKALDATTDQDSTGKLLITRPQSTFEDIFVSIAGAQDVFHHTVNKITCPESLTRLHLCQGVIELSACLDNQCAEKLNGLNRYSH